ncbi:MAG: oxidoreductase [Porticoccaceae bacterium]|nr:MAG: oxidoreductase [Porticoccaceae bacterium]
MADGVGVLDRRANLKGRIAAVVGGAGGILGRAVTLGFAEAGVDVAVLDCDAAAVEAIVPEVERRRRRALAVAGDALEFADLARFFEAVAASYGHLDILVNLVGGVARASFADTTREQNQWEIRANFGYVLDSVRLALPLLRKSGRGGSIVNFTTIEAHRGAATYAVYAGAKAATTNFSRALAVELAAEGIRVNCLAPDTSPAQGANAALRPEDFARLRELGADALERAIAFYVPMKRAPSVDDVVNGVLFLAGDLARSITGTTLHVDGGTSASLGFLDWPGGDGYMPAPLGGSLRRLFPFEGD